MKLDSKEVDMLVLALLIFLVLPAIIIKADSGDAAAFFMGEKYMIILQIFNGIKILMLVFICYFLARIDRKLGPD